jgi:hypothetical protein
MEHPSTPSINSGQASSGQVGHGAERGRPLDTKAQSHYAALSLGH